MSKNSNKNNYRGGKQIRTTEFACGWVCQGHPNEVNKKTARHLRLCIICRSDPDAPAKFVPEKFKAIKLVKGITDIANIDIKFVHVNKQLSPTTSKSELDHRLKDFRHLTSFEIPLDFMKVIMQSNIDYRQSHQLAPP